MRHPPVEVSTKKIPNGPIHINTPRKDSVFWLIKSYLDLFLEVFKKFDECGIENGNDIRLFNPGSIALFSIFKLKTSSGRHLVDFNYAQIVSSIYKLKFSAKK